MTRKAVVDTMTLEFTGGRAKCPHCHMEYARSGLAVRFARCSQMNEMQRRIKNSSQNTRNGEKEDRPFSKSLPRSSVGKMNATDLQKKLTEMIKNSERRASSMDGGTICRTASTTSLLSRRNGPTNNGCWQHCISWQIPKLSAG